MNYLKTIPFSDFVLWDVKRYNYAFNSDFENGTFLRDILIQTKEIISKEELIKNNWSIISKINFQGELFLRDNKEIWSYKGRVNKVPENSIIYSKINVRHGCVYYNEKGSTPFAVSGEYPTFTFDSDRINGYFLKRILRSSEFKKLLNTKTSGISKARVKVDEFLNIKIPLPPKEEQDRIVDTYNQKITLAERQEEKAKQLEQDIEMYLFDALGIKKLKEKDSKKGFRTVSYKNIEKWGVDHIGKAKINYTKDYPITQIQNICSISSGGTPSRSRKEFYTGNIPWIKTGEVLNDIIFNTEEKITNEAINNSSAKLYPKGSLIIAMYGQGKTRGRTAKLGVDASTNQACAVLFDIDNKSILTDYLWVYLMNEYDRLRELASGNNQPNLNAQMIKSYPLIVPPIEIQKNIINSFFNLKEQVKALKEKSEQNRKQAIVDFEKEIFS